MEFGIVLFDTTQAAMRAEKVLIQAGIRIKLIPVPRHISSNCGIALRFDLAVSGKVESALLEEHVPYSAIRPLFNKT